MRPVRKAGNLATFLCGMARNTGTLILLEQERPVQACIGVDLPTYLPTYLPTHPTTGYK